MSRTLNDKALETAKTCESCQHWEPETSRWRCHTKGQKVGQCFREGGEPGSAPLMAAVCSGEGIYGQLLTDARFSCCLWEAIK
jgi:hypothetical protein